MARLRWKKEAAETRLRRVGAGPRGFIYHDGEKRYASVSALGEDWRGPLRGWYWVAGWDSNVPHKNTRNTPCSTPEEAKKRSSGIRGEASGLITGCRCATERSGDSTTGGLCQSLVPPNTKSFINKEKIS